MFGISTFAQAPFSSTAGALYSASATVASDSALTSFANVLKPSVSALIASASTAAGSGERIGVATALIDSSSTIASNGTRYAFGAALVASDSGSSAYGIRYAFGGATIVGESALDVATNRYTFPSALIEGASSILDVGTVTIVNAHIAIDSESDFSASVTYTANGSTLVAGYSSFIANIREKWENEAIATEAWSTVDSTSEIWTVIPAQSENWN